MSHNDYIEQAAPDFKISAYTADCPVAAVENEEKGLYAVQFHPEACGGPHDSEFLFREFVALMERRA